jgi:hypothetical protein
MCNSNMKDDGVCGTEAIRGVPSAQQQDCESALIQLASLHSWATAYKLNDETAERTIILRIMFPKRRAAN